MSINKYIKTAKTAMRTQTNGGIVYMFSQIILKVIYLVPLMFIWRQVTASGIDAGMSLAQLLGYTYVNALLSDILVVKTHLTDWLFEGMLFTRPMPIFGQVIAHTVGEWIPTLLLFSLPMAALAPLFGINIMPTTPWAFLSLALGIYDK